MIAEKPRHARHLLADPSRFIPSICQDLRIRPSTPCRCLHVDDALKTPAQALLGDEAAPIAPNPRPAKARA